MVWFSKAATGMNSDFSAERTAPSLTGEPTKQSLKEVKRRREGAGGSGGGVWELKEPLLYCTTYCNRAGVQASTSSRSILCL